MAAQDETYGPDYPFTTGPRDWYDDGEQDDELCCECGAPVADHTTFGRVIPSAKWHEMAGAGAPTSHAPATKLTLGAEDRQDWTHDERVTRNTDECSTRSPEGLYRFGFYCTRSVGHMGPHAAGDSSQVCARWDDRN